MLPIDYSLDRPFECDLESPEIDFVERTLAYDSIDGHAETLALLNI
jgi:hypothetical protein